MDATHAECPRCGGELVPIVYGEITDPSGIGKVVFGGCGIEDEAPDIACYECDYQGYSAPIVADPFEQALTYAVRLHRTQRRKGTAVPYAAHLLAVASLVLEAGGDEDLAIAALLHDAVEDMGGQPRLREIRAMFGERVADVVAGCSDSDVHPKPPWRERKERYLEHLRSASPDVQLVSLCDKLHNLRSILSDVRVGEDNWGRFAGGRDDTLWYYDEIRKIVDAGPWRDSRAAHELRATRDALREAMRRDGVGSGA